MRTLITHVQWVIKIVCSKSTYVEYVLDDDDGIHRFHKDSEKIKAIVIVGLASSKNTGTV